MIPAAQTKPAMPHRIGGLSNSGGEQPGNRTRPNDMGKMGAPPFKWTEEIENEIFGRIMSGEALSHILGADRDDFLPSERLFYYRLADDPDFVRKYTRAREVQAHRETDQIRDIADSATVEDVNVARLRIDARKWRASKLAPKHYGDRVAIGGAADMDPIKTEDVGGSAKLEAFLSAVSGRADSGASE